MFILKDTNAYVPGLHEFRVSGTTYEPIGKITSNGKPVKCSDHPALIEMATICAQCNDAYLEYNNVIACATKI